MVQIKRSRSREVLAGQYLDRWVGEAKMVGFNIEESMSVIVEPSALVFDTMSMPSSWTVSSGHHSSKMP